MPLRFGENQARHTQSEQSAHNLCNDEPWGIGRADPGKAIRQGACQGDRRKLEELGGCPHCGLRLDEEIGSKT